MKPLRISGSLISSSIHPSTHSFGVGGFPPSGGGRGGPSPQGATLSFGNVFVTRPVRSDRETRSTLRLCESDEYCDTSTLEPDALRKSFKSMFDVFCALFGSRSPRSLLSPSISIARAHTKEPLEFAMSKILLQGNNLKSKKCPNVLTTSEMPLLMIYNL